MVIGLVGALGVLLTIGYVAYGHDRLTNASDAVTERQSAGEPVASAPLPTTRRAADRLARTPDPVRLDRRCETGRVMCVDKTARTMRWVVGGKVRMTFDVRLGGPKTPTREGAFRVYAKSRHHVSSLYGTPMPFAMFFSGGQAVHYSKEFATEGYNGVSHGCVNVRDYRRLAELFDRVRVGDKVIVY